MSWALAALGLAEDADERAVKRAYAARLKVTRPDDDPAGFQQLHETYQAALGWSRQFSALRAAENTIENRRDDAHALEVLAAGTSGSTPFPNEAPPAARPDADGSPLPLPSEAHSSTSLATAVPLAMGMPSIDIAQMQMRILHYAQQQEPELLHAWLLAQPELWSLEHKPEIGTHLQRHLLENEEALSIYSYRVLAEFFDWEQALDATDFCLLQNACTRMHQRWLLQPTGYRELSEALRQRGDGAASVTNVRKLLSLLGTETSNGALFAAMLWPGRPTRMRRLLDLIGYVPDGRKPPPPLYRERASAWYLASERNMFNPIAAMIGTARSLIAAAVFFLLCLFLAMLDHNPAPGMSPVLKVGCYGAALIVGAWVAWDGFISLLRWQSRHETHPCISHPLLQRFFIPAIAALATALIAAGKTQVAAAIALPLLVIALARWARRTGKQLELHWGWSWAWAGIFILKSGIIVVGFLVVYPQATLVVTGIAWLSDLISQWNARKKSVS
ncbi:hypothetical protein HF319_01820 [Xanthomonas sp. Kuri4-1]